MILRFFRAIIVDGKQDEFRQFFLGTALPNLKAMAGAISVSVGLPRPETPNEFCMLMIWKDIASLRAFAGENWQQPVIDPAEAHLLKETHVHHYELHDG